MLATEPSLTGHAESRAQERLGISPAAFRGWVSATHRAWIRVDANWLFRRDVKVSRSDGNHYWVTPWTAETGVVFVVSDDHAVRTIILFNQESRIAREAGGEFTAETARQLVDSAESFRCVAGSEYQPHHRNAVDAYAEGRIDRDDLLAVIAASGRETKKRVLELSIARHEPKPITHGVKVA